MYYFRAKTKSSPRYSRDEHNKQYPRYHPDSEISFCTLALCLFRGHNTPCLIRTYGFREETPMLKFAHCRHNGNSQPSISALLYGIGKHYLHIFTVCNCICRYNTLFLPKSQIKFAFYSLLQKLFATKSTCHTFMVDFGFYC